MLAVAPLRVFVRMIGFISACIIAGRVRQSSAMARPPEIQNQSGGTNSIRIGARRPARLKSEIRNPKSALQLLCCGVRSKLSRGACGLGTGLMSVGLKWNLRWRLSILWFLEWGITGAVMTYLPIYWESINLSRHQQSQLYAVMSIGLWVAPFVVGQVADRWLAMEKVLAISHFVRGISLYAL